MIVIIDYGVGNLFSLKSSFNAIGQEVIISKDKDIISKADKIVLPGVGAFSDAMKKLIDQGLDTVVKNCASRNIPLLGICLGMQLLFETGKEHGTYSGLGILEGDIIPITDVINSKLKVPHMGWNSLQFSKNNNCEKLFKYIKDNDYVYFVHSYFASNCKNSIIATTEYGSEITAAVAKDNIFGCQFHPEKSGSVGLNILKAFCEL
ncbi:MAG: imidazole glycerol phosphate synthase subunit HisH [Aminipila sp.]